MYERPRRESWFPRSHEGTRTHVADSRSCVRLYKVFFFFVPKHNLELLQRWASEIEGLVQPELREYVKEFYAQALKEHENLEK